MSGEWPALKYHRRRAPRRVWSRSGCVSGTFITVSSLVGFRRVLHPLQMAHARCNPILPSIYPAGKAGFLIGSPRREDSWYPDLQRRGGSGSISGWGRGQPWGADPAGAMRYQRAGMQAIDNVDRLVGRCAGRCCGPGRCSRWVSPAFAELAEPSFATSGCPRGLREPRLAAGSRPGRKRSSSRTRPIARCCGSTHGHRPGSRTI